MVGNTGLFIRDSNGFGEFQMLLVHLESCFLFWSTTLDPPENNLFASVEFFLSKKEWENAQCVRPVSLSFMLFLKSNDILMH